MYFVILVIIMQGKLFNTVLFAFYDGYRPPYCFGSLDFPTNNRGLPGRVKTEATRRKEILGSVSFSCFISITPDFDF